MHVLVTCKHENDLIKNNREKVETSFPPLEFNGCFLLVWKPEFWFDLPRNLTQPSFHPSEATHKIWSRLANWPQKVWTTATTDGGPLLYKKLTLWDFGSGELVSHEVQNQIMQGAIKMVRAYSWNHGTNWRQTWKIYVYCTCMPTTTRETLRESYISVIQEH